MSFFAAFMIGLALGIWVGFIFGVAFRVGGIGKDDEK